MGRHTNIKSVVSFISSMTIAIFINGCGGSSDNGQRTGQLIDSAVEGISYTTSSGLSGITDASGSFKYLAGDTVSFSLPPFYLGSTAGASRVTIFDLADAPQPTQQELASYGNSQNNPNDRTKSINKALNLAQLFQSLDADNYPENGITISQNTRNLLSTTTRPLEFEKNGYNFRTQLAKILFQTGVDSKTKKPIAIIRHLVTSGVITTEFFVLSGYEEDTNGDGLANSKEFYIYDTNSNNTQTRKDSNGDGLLDAISISTYDTKHRRIRYEVDYGYDGVFDNITSFEYDDVNHSDRTIRDINKHVSLNEIETSVYNDQGMITLRQKDADGDGTINSTTTFSYDEYGNDILTETDSNMDRIIDYSFSTTYGGATTRVSSIVKQDTNYDGIIDFINLSTYNTNGYQVSAEIDKDNDGVYEFTAYITYNTNNCPEKVIRYYSWTTPSQTFTSIYDENCNLIKETTDDHNDGTTDETSNYRYNASGKEIYYENDNDADGNADHIKHSEYNDNNNLIQERIDANGDGTINTTHIYSYDSHGNQVRHEVHNDDDGIADAITTQTYIQVPNYPQTLGFFVYL